MMSHEAECAAQVAAYANAIVGLDTLAGKGSQLILGRFMEGYGGCGPVASDVLGFLMSHKPIPKRMPKCCVHNIKL